MRSSDLCTGKSVGDHIHVCVGTKCERGGLFQIAYAVLGHLRNGRIIHHFLSQLMRPEPKQRLELIWTDKDVRPNLELRILLEDSDNHITHRTG